MYPPRSLLDRERSQISQISLHSFQRGREGGSAAVPDGRRGSLHLHVLLSEGEAEELFSPLSPWFKKFKRVLIHGSTPRLRRLRSAH
mmetsp:Transcript_3013/g.6691  ORF Transcript_3013/g.6691 Transcript_3013/m.6691 type:complete len:87 (-) Transcript_3013:141-401(-)